MNLNIKVYFQNIWISGLPYSVIRYQAVEYYNTPTIQEIISIGTPQDPNASPNPIFPTVDDAIVYYSDPAGGSVPVTLMGNVNALVGSTVFTSYTVLQVDPPVAALFDELFDELAPIAFTGDFSDLIDVPSIATLPIAESDVTNLPTDLTSKVDKTTTVNSHALSSNVTVTSSDVGLNNVDNTSDANKPVSTATQTALNAKQAAITTGSSSQYLKGDLTLGTTPTLSTVATTGAYSDLTGKPTIPSAQVNSDWNSSSGLSQILNKPSLSTVATSGLYSDLSGKPSIPASQIQSDWNEATTGSLDFIKNKPSLSTVATTGNYTDLSGKPSLATVATSGSYTDLTNQPTIPSVTRTTSSLNLSLVGTGATGTQIHATKDSSVKCTVSTSTTSTIGGPSTSLVVLKICSTNNATEGSWTTVATFESDQTITLALALQSIQIVKGQLCADIPGGWYVKLVNSGTGTHAETFVSGQQTIYG